MERRRRNGWPGVAAGLLAGAAAWLAGLTGCGRGPDAKPANAAELHEWAQRAAAEQRRQEREAGDRRLALLLNQQLQEAAAARAKPRLLFYSIHARPLNGDAITISGTVEVQRAPQTNAEYDELVAALTLRAGADTGRVFVNTMQLLDGR